ncbi:ECF-type sigma factor [Rubrivirga sp.]|uniref:ECF-type sigma factor n=1 Tax=Rubrivirga sp. TaxID=1885344 RepID=UPI003B51AEE0
MDAHDTLGLLSAVRSGDERAADRLFSKVYADLRQLAHRRITAEPGVVTISATGLVHEAYVKMVGGGDWADRSHFLAVAARAMRQILTDRARARLALKRGSGAARVTYVDHLVGDDGASERVLAVHEALDTLAARDPQLASLVELRFFGGLEVAEAADVLGVSTRTAARDWARAKGHLRMLLDAA